MVSRDPVISAHGGWDFPGEGDRAARGQKPDNPMSRQVAVLKGGAEGGGGTQSRRSLQENTRARTPAFRLARGASSQECQGWTRGVGGLGTLAPAICRLLSARGSREAPVVTLAGGKPASVRVEHLGQAPEGARTAKGSKDRSGGGGEEEQARAFPTGPWLQALEGGHFWEEGSAGVSCSPQLCTPPSLLLVENAHSLKTQAKPPSTGPTPATGNDRALRAAGL